MKSRLFLAAPLVLVFYLTSYQHQARPKLKATPSSSAITVNHTGAANPRKTDVNIRFDTDGSAQQLPPAAAGPFHVVRNQIIDSHGQPFLVRGTQLTEFSPQTAAYNSRSET